MNHIRTWLLLITNYCYHLTTPFLYKGIIKIDETSSYTFGHICILVSYIRIYKVHQTYVIQVCMHQMLKKFSKYDDY